MHQKNILFIGAGSLAINTAATLGAPCFGIRRRSVQTPANLTLWQGNVMAPQLLKRVADQVWHTVVITLTPDDRSPKGYELGYLAPVTQLLNLWTSQGPEHVIFASSTAVYGQNQGQWVDETSECAPSQYNGQILLATEQLIAQSGLNHTILRLGGIYGSGRDFLQRQVAQGKGGDSSYTNRIHETDAVACIAWLISGGEGQGVLNVCDSNPAPANQVRRWLAEQMQVTKGLTISSSGRGGNKRVSNQKLIALGFELRYPSFKEGYSAILAGE